jgi:hypothetical protein
MIGMMASRSSYLACVALHHNSILCLVALATLGLSRGKNVIAIIRALGHIGLNEPGNNTINVMRLIEEI